MRAFFKSRPRLTASAVAVLAIVATTVGLASQPSRPVLNLDAYQDANGIIRTFKNGDASDPYFGVYPLVLAQRAGLNADRNARRFIAWGLAHQGEDGRFPRFCKVEGSWSPCKRADSDDATLARWIELLYRTAGDGPLPATWRQSIARAEAALLKLRLANGVYSVFPHDTPGYDGYALFKDNVEVLSAAEAIAGLLDVRKDADDARRWHARARRLRAAMEVQFGDKPFALKRLALPTDYDKKMFYPHAVAIPFAWAEGYIQSPGLQLWKHWLADNKEAWKANAETDYPWGLMAVAGAQAGDLETAACWMKKYRSYQQKDYRWTVLEESAAQVVQYKTAGVRCTQPF